MFTQEKIKFGLYIHWPFCIKKCPYCDFNSYTFAHNPETWVDALINEMEQSKIQFPYYEIVTIFFGGGTPSLIPPLYINKLIQKAYQLWPQDNTNHYSENQSIYKKQDYLLKEQIDSDIKKQIEGDVPSNYQLQTSSKNKRFDNFVSAKTELHSAHARKKDTVEITLETNPSTVETHDLAEFVAAGINRFSIGMQSLNDYNLQFLGRTHSAKEAIEILTHSATVCSNVSADFIYTLPHENLATWKNDLDSILKLANQLNLKHLSLYQLTIENNTAFAQQVSAKLWEPMDEDRQSVLYKHTYETLLKNDWNFYEISNASKNTKRNDKKASDEYKSKHNLIYWNYQPYLGLGPGAHSRMLDEQGNRIKFHNIKSPYKWLETIYNKDITYLKQKLELEKLTKQAEFQEKMLMGLRLTDGVNIENDMQFINKNNFDNLIKHNFITFDGTKLKTTLRGRLCLNSVLKVMLEEE